MKKTAGLITCGAVLCFSLAHPSKIFAQTVSMTQGSMNVVSGNTGACNNGTYTTENNYLRSFKVSDYVNCSTFRVDSVRFGIDQAASVFGSQLLDINLYTIPNGSTLSYANLTQVDVFNGSLSDITTPEVVTVPFSTDITGSLSLVVEISSPDGTGDHIFFMGSNNQAQTKPSYMSAPSCNINDITNISTLGLPSPVSLVIGVYGHSLDLPKPDTFTAGKSIVCKGEAVDYTVPAVTGMMYNWTYSGSGVIVNNNNNSANLVFLPTATSGVLSVVATDGNLTSSPRTLNITVNPIPAPTISRAGDVLTSSTASSYAWYRNNIAITGANSSTYTMTQNGAYFVKVTQNGCSGNSDTVQITDVGTGTAVNEIHLKNIDLIVAPNPATDILNILCKIPVNASVFGTDGKQVLSIKNAKQIDISHLNAGLYYVLFTTESGMHLKREKVVKL